jgi:serine/threonine protein kinase
MIDDDTNPGREPQPGPLHGRDTVSFVAERIQTMSQSLVVAEEFLENETPHRSRSGELLDNKYLLQEQIGQGGMGTVWRAEQVTPLERAVAVKFLRTDLRRRQSVPRFAVEQQMLASMSHPNIASVFDSGLSNDNEPYLVMELIDGVPLHTFCDRQRLTIAERLRLVVRICSAIEHAHQRGIIHRDLKPSNILVANTDGVPVPKVIDFGLAKALPWSTCVGDSADRTLPGDLVGTPLYMAPEQIVSPDAGIDTRTDVYAIGVILYELVIGEVPFPPVSHEDGGWLQTLHRIVHEEPQRPSHRIRASKDEAVIATARGVRSGDLTRIIRGDLEWIILKAIAKQPKDRYASVTALRKDIQRLLSKHPIHARPATLAYRANRFFCRHRLLVCLTVLLGLAMVGGLTATTWALLRTHAAQAETRIALARERQANDRTRRAIATLAASLCDDSRGGACEAIAFQQIVSLHDIISDDEEPHDHRGATAAAPGSEAAAEVYRHVLSLLDRLHREQPLSNYRCLSASVRTRLAQELEAAGFTDSAIEEYRRSEAVLRQLVAEEPANAGYRQRLAAVQMHTASHAEANSPSLAPFKLGSSGDMQ